jgi:hypothetical protein
MATFVDTPTRQFTVGATAIGEHLRVKLTAGLLVVAGVGVTDEPSEIGSMSRPGAIGEVVGVILRNKQGTTKMMADGVVAIGVVVYGAAAGKIGTTASGAVIGVSCEAAAANNDIIEVQRY